MNLSHRSYEKEFLDEDQIPFDDIRQNLKELNIINTYLGGHQITLSGIQSLLTQSTKPVHIAEIGCGGGDNLAFLAKRLKGNFVYTGVDIKKTCIDFAQSTYPDINFIRNDYRKSVFESPPDIIFSSLFCHHFTNDELIDQFKWLKEHAKLGFVINDLHRHKLAYHAIKLLTQLFSNSYLVKNDAPLSVARGFKKAELINLLNEAGIKKYEIQWKWAFRYLVIAHC